MIYNASGYEKESDARVRDFLRFIHTNEPGTDDFANRLSAMVEKIKDDEKFRKEFAAMNLHDRDLTRIVRKEALAEGIQEGLNRGMMEKAVEDAVKVIRKYNADPTEAARDFNAPIEKVMEMLNQSRA